MDSEVILAKILEEGSGVAVDLEKAAALLKRAVRSGDLQALSMLGRLYESGKGVEKSEEWAVYLFERAWNGGEPSVARHFGICYYEDRGGLGRDVRKAFQLFTLASEAGDREDTLGLGLIEEAHHRNHREALHQFKVAAKGGNKQAMTKLASAYSQEQPRIPIDMKAARYWTRRCTMTSIGQK